MRSVRPLLTQGNGKLGGSIFHFDLLAVTTCPGRSAACAACYATQGRYVFPQVRERLAWNGEQSRRKDFARRLAREIHRKGILVVRLHSSGDFYSRAYARQWLAVMRQCPRVRFYFYTRSWRVPAIAPLLEAMARLPNCRAWYSIDADTGVPERVPPGVRLAYLQVQADERPARADLVFRVRRLRRQRRRVGLPMVCPHETPEGRAREVNCGNCGYCWL